MNLLREPSENYRLASLNLAVVEALEQVSRSLVPDMPDRIIAATALSLGLPLLSCDRAQDKLRTSVGAASAGENNFALKLWVSPFFY